MRMNQKGQAFDVFKLLIAAVVAIAILLILQQTLQVIPNFNNQAPNELAKGQVKSKVNDIGNPQLVENVIFKQADSLNAKTIAEASNAISADQLCVMVSNSAPNKSNFVALGASGSSGQIVRYDGTSAQKTRLMILCDREKDIESTLETYGYSSQFGISLSGSCRSLDSAKTQKFCVVAIISES